jgi:hypothetical protein
VIRWHGGKYEEFLDETGTGAGLELNGGSMRLDGVAITGNATGSGAGAIHAARTNLVVMSSVIASNIGNAGAIVADPPRINGDRQLHDRQPHDAGDHGEQCADRGQ